MGATVTLRNHETNQVLQTQTDERGQYRILYVPVGQYHLTVSAPGFATTNVNLDLGIGQAIDVPLTMPVAAAASDVSVVAEAPIVDAGRTHTADTITPREVDAPQHDADLLRERCLLFVACTRARETLNVS